MSTKKPFDTNTVIGILLIGAIFLYFGYFNSSQEVDTTGGKADTVVVDEKKNEAAALIDTAVTSETPTAIVDSLDTTVMVSKFYKPAAGTEEHIITLENELVELKVSSTGGKIVSARLKNFKTYDSLPLYLINDNAEFNLELNDGKVYNTADLYFEASRANEQGVTMTMLAGEGKTISYTYSLEPNSYMVNWDVKTEGLSKAIGPNSGLQWEMNSLRHEKNAENERTNTILTYRFSSEDDVDELSVRSDDQEEEENIKWVAFKQQFFSSILLNKSDDFDKAGLVTKVLPEEQTTHTRFMATKVSLGAPNADINAQLALYLGPNKFDLLKEQNQGFEELVPLGWGIFGWINQGFIIKMFNWLEGYGIGYGIIILIIALVIKMILFPLTFTSYKSMAKMRVLKPEIDEINEKHKDSEPMKKQQATMELYQKAGVNPLGGCLPMVLQMPILIALFRFFPSSIELRQQSFLWADDLSTYDSIWNLPFEIPFYGDHVSLFTLLMTVSTLIYTYMNQQMSGSNQQMPQLKYMMYLMPIIFLGVFNNYASGLSYYYFLANMITFGQQFAIRAFLDDKKILAKIQEKKAQPKKENRLMRRMKDMQEDQNRQARRKK